jgi:ankyrin repeat protein
MMNSQEWFDAAFDGDLWKITQMIQDGMEIDTIDADHRTALHIACCEGHAEMVQLLIKLGARHDVKADRWGNSPLKCAIVSGHSTIKKVLEVAGAILQPECRNDLEFKLCRSASQGNVSTLQILIDNGMSVNTVDYGGRSLLHLAASNGHANTVDFLLKRGACIDCKDGCGLRPIDVASIEGHVQVEETIKCALEKVHASYFPRLITSRSHDPTDKSEEAQEPPTSDVDCIVDSNCNAIAALSSSSAPTKTIPLSDAAISSPAHSSKRRGSAPAEPPGHKRACCRLPGLPTPSLSALRVLPIMPPARIGGFRPAAAAVQPGPELGLADSDVRDADAAAAAASDWDRRWSGPKRRTVWKRAASAPEPAGDLAGREKAW